MNPKHQKETTYSKLADGSVKIEAKSYYENLSQEMVEIEKHIPTSFYSLKKDIETAIAHVTDEKSPQLVLTIKVVDDKPRLTKRWVTLKKSYPRQ